MEWIEWKEDGGISEAVSGPAPSATEKKRTTRKWFLLGRSTVSYIESSTWHVTAPGHFNNSTNQQTKIPSNSFLQNVSIHHWSFQFSWATLHAAADLWKVAPKLKCDQLAMISIHFDWIHFTRTWSHFNYKGSIANFFLRLHQISLHWILFTLI